MADQQDHKLGHSNTVEQDQGRDRCSRSHMLLLSTTHGMQHQKAVLIDMEALDA